MQLTGQTGEVLRVTLPSKIISARFVATAVAHNSSIDIEVRTHWVGDNSELTISVMDMDGNEVDNITGKVIRDIFRVNYNAQVNNTMGLYFSVDMPDHGLYAESAPMRVFPEVIIQNFKYLDKDDQELEYLEKYQEFKAQATIQGPPDGTECIVTLYESLKENSPRVITSNRCKIQDGIVTQDYREALSKLSKDIDTHQKLNPDGLDYYQPTYFFRVECFGTEADSHPIIIAHNMVLEFNKGSENNAFAGKELKITAPDGTEETQTIPDDGLVVVTCSKPGKYSWEVV